MLELEGDGSRNGRDFSPGLVSYLNKHISIHVPGKDKRFYQIIQFPEILKSLTDLTNT